MSSCAASGHLLEVTGVNTDPPGLHVQRVAGTWEHSSTNDGQHLFRAHGRSRSGPRAQEAPTAAATCTWPAPHLGLHRRASALGFIRESTPRPLPLQILRPVPPDQKPGTWRAVPRIAALEHVATASTMRNGRHLARLVACRSLQAAEMADREALLAISLEIGFFRLGASAPPIRTSAAPAYR